jgi:hypothetical protein
LSHNASRDDEALGMNRPIDRRDFLNGVAVAVGALGTGLAGGARAAEPLTWPQDRPDYYPPLLTGLRGSHPGSFENAHHLSSTLRILGGVRIRRSDAGPEDSFVGNDGKGLVEWHDSSSEGASWRPAFFPRRPIEDFDAVVAPGWPEPGDGAAGLGMMERVSAVPLFAAHGPPGAAEALDARDDAVTDYWLHSRIGARLSRAPARAQPVQNVAPASAH